MLLSHLEFDIDLCAMYMPRMHPNLNKISVLRAAQAVSRGLEMLALAEESKSALVAAAEAKKPPVTVLAPIVGNALGAELLRQHAVRRFLGLAVSSVLAEQGFEVARKGVRLRDDPVFTTASLYRRAGQLPLIEAPDILERMLAGLTKPEQLRALKFLQTQLKQ
jgi:hypothetical protein